MSHKDKPATRLAHTGRDPVVQAGVVNPPVYRASTVVFPTVAALEKATQQPFEGTYYGRIGTPSTRNFEDAMSDLEGAYRAVSTSSGLAAIAISLMAFTRSGDHVLIADTVYGPTRKFCDRQLTTRNVNVEYFDPLIGAGISERIQETTTVVFLESPGSLTFEVQDVPAIVRAAHSRGARVLMDNTWATPLYFNALRHGVDVSIHAATKYIVGHADAMLGVINTVEDCFETVKSTAVMVGNCPGSEECFLGLRGLRTLDVRLQRHQQNAFVIATWLAQHPMVKQVYYPALSSDTGHALWRRDFSGASGLFSLQLIPCEQVSLRTMLDEMRLFAMGYSWGGYESLILPIQPAVIRSATDWQAKGPCLRIHIGLEQVEDLIEDLKNGFDKLKPLP